LSHATFHAWTTDPDRHRLHRWRTLAYVGATNWRGMMADQSSVIFGFLFFAFLVFVTMRGELRTYMGFLLG
jgi:hypothetical protein